MKFKKWVVDLLVTNIIIAILVASCECIDLNTYIIKGVASIIIMIINIILLNKYSNIFKD